MVTSVISEEKGERKCKKKKKNSNDLGAIRFEKNANHHHLSVCDLQLEYIYIIKINLLGVWKVLTKKVLLEKLEKLMWIWQQKELPEAITWCWEKPNKDNKYLVKYYIFGFTFQNPSLW